MSNQPPGNGRKLMNHKAHASGLQNRPKSALRVALGNFFGTRPLLSHDPKPPLSGRLFLDMNSIRRVMSEAPAGRLGPCAERV